jgi:hypothetical protein
MEDSIPRYILLNMSTLNTENNVSEVMVQESVSGTMKTVTESSANDTSYNTTATDMDNEEPRVVFENTIIDFQSGTEPHMTPVSSRKKNARKSPRLASQPTVTGKRTRTPVELFSPTSITSAERSPKRTYRRQEKTPTQTPKEIMSKMEKKHLSLKAKCCEDPSNDALRDSSKLAEREFYKAVVSLSLRQNARTKWKGWELGYAKLCSLSDAGQEYAKTACK